jgi:Flp pilus assembly protein TadG
METCSVQPRLRTPGARHRALRRGSALVYITAVMVALIAFASLAVDLGHVWVVRNELQVAADSAARYGVSGLASGVTAAQNCAVDAADDNKADGTPVVIDPATDVDFLSWDKATRTSTVLTGAARSGANAMRVTCRRTAASGGGVQLLFARVIGRTSHNVEAASIAYVEPQPQSGIVGYSGVTMKNNTFIGAYNSATNPNPTEATATSAGSMLSNGAISGGSNNTMSGAIVLGPGAPAVSGISVSGGITRLTQAMVPPADAPWTPAANPGGVAQNYTVNGNVTLPGGAYWFTSLTVKGTLTFGGAATVTVNGPILVSGALRANNLIPANLKIYQLGGYDFGDDDINGADIVADVVAPGADFIAKNNLEFRGRLIVRSIDVRNGADIFYDISLGTGSGGSPRIITVR